MWRWSVSDKALGTHSTEALVAVEAAHEEREGAPADVAVPAVQVIRLGPGVHPRHKVQGLVQLQLVLRAAAALQ